MILNSKNSILFAFLSVFVTLFSYSQTSLKPNDFKKLDSMQRILRNTKVDTAKAFTLNSISELYLRLNNNDKCMAYADSGLKFSEQIQFKDGIIRGNFLRGRVHLNVSDFYSAYADFNETNKLAKKFGHQKYFISSAGNLAVAETYLGNYPEALKNFMIVLAEKIKTNDIAAVSVCYGNISGVYYFMKNYKTCLKYALMECSLAKKMNDKRALSGSYSNVVMSLTFLRNYPEAIKYNNMALILNAELGNKNGIKKCYSNFSNIYTLKNEFQKAMEFSLKSNALAEELGNKDELSAGYINTSIILCGLGKFNEAKIYAEKGLSLSKQTGRKEWTKNAYKSLSDIYKKTGDYKLSMEYYEKYNGLNDSLQNTEKTKEISDLEAKFEFDKQQAIKEAVHKKEFEKQEAVSQSEHKKKNVIIYSIIGGLVLVLIFSFFLFNRFRIIQKQKSLIEEQKALVDEKQKEILDSIRYAKRIQTALITSEKHIEKNLNKLMK